MTETQTMEPLHQTATGRSGSMFTADVEHRAEALRAAISEKRILVIGGAGSIGSSTIQQLLRHKPRALHVVDQNENGLAEFVRSLRAQPDSWHADDCKACLSTMVPPL